MSNESTEQYRAGFEAWARDKGPWPGVPLDRLSSGEYRHPGIQGDWTVWLASKREASTEPSAIPDVLFDGSSVYDEIVRVKGHRDHYVVSDTLDAVVRLMRKAGPESGLLEHVKTAETRMDTDSEGGLLGGPKSVGALTDSLADQLAQARYADYVQECDRRGLRPSSFYGFKVVCAEVEHAICVQVLIRCRHPASSSADDAKDVARWRWLREHHDAGDEQWFVYGAKDLLDSDIDAAIEAHTKAGS